MLKKITICLIFLAWSSVSFAGYFPMFSSWEQPGGPGSPITLTYSYSNLFDGNIINSATGDPMSTSLLRSMFETALWDYASVLPIHFIEINDYGPLPETGDYDPVGLADIRIGQVPHVDGANAYAYFPTDVLYADFGDNPVNGLAGDIVFNAQRFGSDWSEILFYIVAQHELGHSLGMGHFVDGDPHEEDLSLEESTYEGPVIPLSSDMVIALQGVYGAGVGSVTPVPLPAAIWLFTIAMAFLGFRVRN
jgi:matrixin